MTLQKSWCRVGLETYQVLPRRCELTSFNLRRFCGYVLTIIAACEERLETSTFEILERVEAHIAPSGVPHSLATDHRSSAEPSWAAKKTALASKQAGNLSLRNRTDVAS